MLIDWFTVIAQVVNFAILLVALKFLLYDRVLEAMERRRLQFAEREHETDRLRGEAEEERRRVEKDRLEIEANWEAMIEEARQEADDRRRELLEQARSEVEFQEKQWRDSLRVEKVRLVDELQRRTGEQAVSLARHALRDLADAELEDGVVRAFVRRVDDLAALEGDAIVDAFRAKADVPVRVRTAYAMSQAQRDEVRRSIHALVLDPRREIEWERDPTLVSGIVAEVGARGIGWTIDTYLDGVENMFAGVFDRRLGEDGTPGADRTGPGPDGGSP
jgi:F-type H+-transporting ATPase subunit b